MPWRVNCGAVSRGICESDGIECGYLAGVPAEDAEDEWTEPLHFLKRRK